MSELLTDAAFIRRLESLWLLARKVLSGSLQSDRKSIKKGSGITFADYSEYTLGDDYRSIDWRVYARLGTLMVKLFEREEDVTIYLLLDSSKSMDQKYLLARQLSAALGYIGLNILDRVVIYGLADELETIMPKSQGRGKTLTMLKALENAKTFGKDSDFTTCCRQLQARHRQRGVVIVASDFLFPQGYEEGLKLLKWCNHDIFCMQVMDKTDLSCNLRGDVDLHCVESDSNMKITVTPSLAARYEASIKQYCEDFQRYCARQGIGSIYTTTDVRFDDIIQKVLRRGGLVA
jgi:uncharacterized protein (DUF58 family)